MKIVLISTPYKDLYGPDKAAVGHYFPLGLGYIASVLRNAGHNVRLYDPEAGGITENELIEIIKGEKPDLVGFSCLTSTFLNSVKIAKRIKERTGALIIAGGCHPSALPELVLKEHKDFDIVVIGEGEETMPELCSALENNSSLSEVKGIMFREDGKLKRTPPRPYIEDLDKIPHPARDLVDLRPYHRPHMYWDIGLKSATMIASRGCPFACIFCASKATLGWKLRLHSPEYVVNEMALLKKDFGIEYISFMDDTFTINKNWVTRVCQLIKERNLKISWSALMRVDTVDESLLKIMKDAGCRKMSFGIETGDPYLLKECKKGTTLDQARIAVKAAKKMGFKVVNSYMFGFPSESQETVKNTIDFARELNPHIALFSILTPYPGTQTYEDLMKKSNGLINNWSDFVFTSGKAVIPIGNMSPEDLKKALSMALVKFYLRPSQFIRIMGSIETPKEFMIFARGSIGVFRKIIGLPILAICERLKTFLLFSKIKSKDIY